MAVGIASIAEPDVRALLSLHQRRMFDASPPGTSFALDLEGLSDAGIPIFALRGDDGLLGVCALKALSAHEGEIKAMRTADHALRRGVGQALLDHVARTAAGRGYRRLLLETGTGPVFEAANRLYMRNGFARCGAFGGYTPSAFNIFYERSLRP